VNSLLFFQPKNLAQGKPNLVLSRVGREGGQKLGKPFRPNFCPFWVQISGAAHCWAKHFLFWAHQNCF